MPVAVTLNEHAPATECRDDCPLWVAIVETWNTKSIGGNDVVRIAVIAQPSERGDVVD